MEFKIAGFFFLPCDLPVQILRYHVLVYYFVEGTEGESRGKKIAKIAKGSRWNKPMCVWVSGGRSAAMSLPKPALAFDLSLHPPPSTRGSDLGAANKKHCLPIQCP